VWRFYLGNGSARAVAAMLVWILFEDHILGMGKEEPALGDFMLSFLTISTSYECHGDGSDRAAIVATIARQEQDAQVQGVTTVDWIRIIMRDRGITLGEASLKSRADVLKAMTDFLQQYEQLPEVHAYDDQATVPRATGRGRSAAKKLRVAEGEEEDKNVGQGIRVGSRKLQAIKTFLAHGTDEMLTTLETHLHYFQYKHAAVTDAILGNSALYGTREVGPDVQILPEKLSTAHGVPPCSWF
jgi:hypothetical protein